MTDKHVLHKTYFVTWMHRDGKIRTRKFNSLYQARVFANRLNTAGLEITHV